MSLYGVEILRLLVMLSCFRRCQRSRLGLSYCWGLPERERGHVPCRLINDVLPWTAPDDYSDAQVLPDLIRALATDTFAALCPAYDAGSVQTAAAVWGGGRGRVALNV